MELSKSEKESNWRELVSRFESSGLSQSEFSKREGLVKSQLSYWLRKFRDSSPASSFVEIPTSSTLSSPSVELEFSNGLTLKIRA